MSKNCVSCGFSLGINPPLWKILCKKCYALSKEQEDSKQTTTEEPEVKPVTTGSVTVNDFIKELEELEVKLAGRDDDEKKFLIQIYMNRKYGGCK